MSKFEKVKTYYDNYLWSISQVKNAVVKRCINAEEFFTITHEEYQE